MSSQTDSQDSSNKPEIFNFYEIYKQIEEMLRQSELTRKDKELLAKQFLELFTED